MSYIPLKQQAEQVWECYLNAASQNFHLRAHEDGILQGENAPKEQLASGGDAPATIEQGMPLENKDIRQVRFFEDVRLVRHMFDIVVETMSPQPGPTLQAQAPLPMANSQVTSRPNILMAEIPSNKMIVEHPKSSGIYYVLDCALCGRHFHNAQSLYAHINQTDAAHQGILMGEKKFAKAVAVCGFRIDDATTETVKEHNAYAEALFNVSCSVCLSYFRGPSTRGYFI
jgi:hypothetical protein